MSIQSTSITLVGDTGLLACKSCKYCIFPTGLDRHFGRKPHSLSPSERTSLLIGVEKDASLIRNKAGIKNLEIPPSFPFFYLELALYRDGIKCQDCGYITRNTRSIRDHYSEVHSWENPRKKGRPSKSTKENVPWKIEIPCQQYFPKEFGSQYFLVNPKKPWVAGASREETGFLEERASSAESRRSSRISLETQGIFLSYFFLKNLLIYSLDLTIWEAEIARLNSEVESSQKRQISKIQKGKLDDPSPWLDRTRWADYLEGLNRPYLVGLVGEPDTPLLRVISSGFENLARKSQETVSNIGSFGRFEIVRTEKNQFRAKPFRVYQNTERISTYSLSWKRIFFFFIRTQIDWDSGQENPRYSLSKTQKNLLERLIRIAEETDENSESQKSSQNSTSDENEASPTREDSENEETSTRNTSIISSTRARPKPSSLTRIERACLDFSISLLDQQAKEDEYELLLVGALAVLGLEEKGWKGVDSYPSLLSSFIKISRFLVLWFSLEKSSTLDTDSDSDSGSDTSTYSLGIGNRGVLERISFLVDRFLVRGSRSPINWALDLRSYGLNIAQNTTKEGLIEWSNETILYGRISFSISNFRAFIHGLLSSTRATLFEDVLFQSKNSTTESTISIPEIPWSRIFDNPLDSTPFSNFLQDSRTDLGVEDPKNWLIRKIASRPDLASRFRAPGEETFTWNSRKLEKWLTSLSVFLEKLLVLIHLGGGQPARAPELLSIRSSNSIETGLRNLYVENGLLSFITFYHKGYSISGSTKIIHRYLPREIGSLLVYYLWLVAPFQKAIGLGVFRTSFSEYLFENPVKKTLAKSNSRGLKTARKYTPEQFRRFFRRETQTGLGVSINPSEYRHLAIGISRKYLRKNLQFQPEEQELDIEKDEDYSDDILATQEDGKRSILWDYLILMVESRPRIISLATSDISGDSKILRRVSLTY